MQLQPFLDAYGFATVLPVFFPRLVTHSQAELERIGRFLGHDGPLRWDEGLEPQNPGTGAAASQPGARGPGPGAGADHDPAAGRAPALVASR